MRYYFSSLIPELSVASEKFPLHYRSSHSKKIPRQWGMTGGLSVQDSGCCWHLEATSVGANLVARFPCLLGGLPAVSQYHHPLDTPATCQLAFGGKLESEWSTFLLGAREKRAAKSPGRHPSPSDMQTKLAAWKHAEKECKCGCVRQSTEGPGKWHSSFLLGRGVMVLSEPGAEWREQSVLMSAEGPELEQGGAAENGLAAINRLEGKEQLQLRVEEQSKGGPKLAGTNFALEYL